MYFFSTSSALSHSLSLAATLTSSLFLFVQLDLRSLSRWPTHSLGLLLTQSLVSSLFLTSLIIYLSCSRGSRSPPTTLVMSLLAFVLRERLKRETGTVQYLDTSISDTFVRYLLLQRVEFFSDFFFSYFFSFFFI